jgi:hypothetical protein
MSKHNKQNRDAYTQAGRLTPDEAAREVKKQREVGSPSRTDGKPQPHRAAPSSVTGEDKTDVEEEDLEQDVDEQEDDEQDDEQDTER